MATELAADVEAISSPVASISRLRLVTFSPPHRARPVERARTNRIRRRRYLDTRLVGLPMGDGEHRVLHLHGWVPHGSTSVELIVIVLDAQRRGTLTFRTDGSLHSCDEIEFGAGTPVLARVTVPLGRSEIVHVHTSASTDLVIDLAVACFAGG